MPRQPNLDVNELDDAIITHILANKDWPDDEKGYELIGQLTVQEAFNAWCNYEGLINYGPKITRVLNNINAAKIKQPDNTKFGLVQWTIEQIKTTWVQVHGEEPFPTGPDNQFSEIADDLALQLLDEQRNKRFEEIERSLNPH